MIVGIIGESCVGKSTLAHQLKAHLSAEVYTGKDYLRLAKSESIAKKLFEKKLQEAAPEEHIIYVISDLEHVALLPEGAFRIVMSTDLKTIKERFAQRMHGHLPDAVSKMLERKHGCFDELNCHLRLTDKNSVDEVIEKLANYL